jgi:protein-L-isoaspartate O-methyltransferase
MPESKMRLAPFLLALGLVGGALAVPDGRLSQGSTAAAQQAQSCQAGQMAKSQAAAPDGPQAGKAAGPQQQPAAVAEKDYVAPYIPSPMRIVEKMLEVAKVTEGDKVFDLGSGDGRIVITAAQKFGAEAVGVELDEELVRKASARVAELNLQDRVKIMHADLFKTDMRSATVVTLYLVDSINERLRPVFEEQLRPGTRVVVHDFRIPGWEPREVVTVKSEMDVPHQVYLYVKQ